MHGVTESAPAGFDIDPGYDGVRSPTADCSFDVFEGFRIVLPEPVADSEDKECCEDDGADDEGG